jgi:hypothetical protein
MRSLGSAELARSDCGKPIQPKTKTQPNIRRLLHALLIRHLRGLRDGDDYLSGELLYQWTGHGMRQGFIWQANLLKHNCFLPQIEGEGALDEAHFDGRLLVIHSRFAILKD